MFRSDLNKPKTEPFGDIFTTGVVSFFPAQDRGLVIIRIVIDNQDTTNNLTFTKNGRGGIVFTIPPNALGIIEDEVLTGIRIVPNGATGLGQFTGDLASNAELLTGGFLA